MPKIVTPSALHGDNSLQPTVGGTAHRLKGYASNAIAIGATAMGSATTPPADNIAIGSQALGTVVNGGSGGSVAIGTNALINASTGGKSVGIGTSAMSFCNAPGGVGVGHEAGSSSGVVGTFVGYQAGKAITTNLNSTMVGYQAGVVATGANNSLFGASAGSLITTGSSNTCFGSQAGITFTTGSNNTLIGYTADTVAAANAGGTAVGYATKVQNFSTAIGYNTFANAQGSVVIGTDSSGGASTTSVVNEFKFGTANHLYNFPGKVNATLTLNDGVNIACGTTTGSRIPATSGQKLAFWGSTPVIRDTGWTMSGYTADRVLNAASTTLNETAAVLATLIDTLKTYGLLG